MTDPTDGFEAGRRASAGMSEPTDEQIDAILIERIYDGDRETAEANDWCAEVGRPLARAILKALTPPAVVPEPAREPDGYAYAYPGPWGGIAFTNGEERNGSKPVRAIPYFFGAARPAAAREPERAPGEAPK